LKVVEDDDARLLHAMKEIDEGEGEGEGEDEEEAKKESMC
jgi:hypothetical protein